MLTADETSNIIKSILIETLQIEPAQFDWVTPLQQFNQNFKVLGFLIDLEDALKTKFKQDIQLIEQISPAIHTPEDIVQLILKLKS